MTEFLIFVNYSFAATNMYFWVKNGKSGALNAAAVVLAFGTAMFLTATLEMKVVP